MTENYTRKLALTLRIEKDGDVTVNGEYAGVSGASVPDRREAYVPGTWPLEAK